MMRFGVSLVLALTIAAGLPEVLAAQNYSYGEVTQTMSPNHGAKLTELGVGYVRLDFNWFEIEPQQDQYNWGFLDDRVTEVRNRGIRIFATLAYTPEWAGPPWTGECVDGHCMPYNLWDWYDFVYQVMSRYRSYGNDITYGIWNEPNLHFLNDDSAGNKYRDLYYYADLARDAVGAYQLMGGPETSHHAVGDGYYASVMSKINPYMATFDTVTVHWYPDGPYFPTYMDKVRAETGARAIWLTETGVNTCDDNYQVQRYDYMLNEFIRRGRGWWTRVFFYVLHNGLYCGETIVRDPDWTNRPAFDYYRNFIIANP